MKRRLYILIIALVILLSVIIILSVTGNKKAVVDPVRTEKSADQVAPSGTKADDGIHKTENEEINIDTEGKGSNDNLNTEDDDYPYEDTLDDYVVELEDDESFVID